MILTYAGASRPSAEAIAQVLGDSCRIVREAVGDINWGRAYADTRLNSDTSKVTNKRVMRELFDHAQVPMPRLVNLDEWDGETPIVGRPDRHSRKRGFWLCNTMADVEKALRGTRRKKPATHFMEFVTAEREYRCHIFQGRSIRISEKVFTEGNNYTTGKPRHAVDHVRSAAKQAVAAVGLDFGAVDILATDTEAWVLEVNSAPGLGGSMPQVYAQKFLNWMQEQNS